MKNVKKIVALAMCATLSMGILTSCGNSKSTSGDDPVNLTWYCIGDPPKDEVLVEEEINKYLKEKINASVDMKFVGFGDYDQKTSVIVNSGEAFDIMFTCDWAGDYSGNSTKGAFLELDEYFETTLKDTYKAIDKRFWEGAKINGKTYAIPNQKELCSVPSWVFDKALVEKYNIPIQDIQSLEDLEPWLKLIKEKEPDVIPLGWAKDKTPPTKSLEADVIVVPLMVDINDESLTVKNMFEDEKFIASLKTMEKYYNAGYVYEEAPIVDVFNRKDQKCFITESGWQPYADNIWSQQEGKEVVSNPVSDPLVTTASTRGSMFAVAKNSKNPEKAIEFLNLLNTDEKLRNMVNFGIEGVHYEKIGDNQIKQTDKKSDYGVSYFAMGNLYKTYVLENDPVDKWDEFKKFNDGSVESPLLGFAFNPEAVANEIAAISNVINEFRPALYSGSVNVDETLEKLNARLKSQGLDKVQEEIQKQINEWAKENIK